MDFEKMNKKYQIFISSPYKGMEQYRDAAYQAVLKSGHIPAGMELFCAENNGVFEIIKNWIEQSDIYVLIMGDRYGSIENKSKKSYTHLEYEYACSIKKPRFYLLTKSEPTDDGSIENFDKYLEFREIIKSEKMCCFFDSEGDLKFEIAMALKSIYAKPELQKKGWIRLDELELNSRKEELTGTQVDEERGKMYSTPKINWKTYIGKQKWRNTPLSFGDSIIVGSAGYSWNESDSDDGIYCINSIDGKINWFFESDADVNEITLFEDRIIAGSDSGKVHCVSVLSGELIWETACTSGVSTKILLYNLSDVCTRAIVVSYDGIVNVVDISSGVIVCKIDLGKEIMSNPVLDDENIYIVSKSGELFILTYDFRAEDIKIKKVFKLQYKYEHEYLNDYGMNPAEVYSTLLISENSIFVAYARETYDKNPPIMCIDKNTGELIWNSKDKQELSGSFGNIRSDMLVYDDELIFTHAYSNELVGVSKKNGEVIWVENVGRPMFWQWASPNMNDKYFILPRYDGYLYLIDKKTKKRVFSVFLSKNSEAGSIYGMDEEQPNLSFPCSWELDEGHPLLSKAIFDSEGNIICGSDEGYFYSISIN